MRLTLRISHVARDGSAELSPQCGSNNNSGSFIDSAAGACSEIAEAQQYMRDHNLKDKLTQAVLQLLRERPENPMQFLADVICSEPCSSSVPIGGRSCARSSTLEQLSVLSREINEDSIHAMPQCVSLGGVTRLLDFGSGETGFYSYRMDKTDGKIEATGCKAKTPFFASFVEPWCVDAFCEALVEAYELPCGDTEEMTFFGGATGLHRELLTENVNAAERTNQFLKEASRVLSRRIGGTPAKIWLFVPSGLLEAQFELYATEWLVGRATLLGGEWGDGRAKASGSDSGRESCGSVLVQKAFEHLDGQDDGGTPRRSDVRKRMESELNIHGHSKGQDASTEISYDQFRLSVKNSRVLQQLVQTMIFSGTISAGGGSCQMAMMGGLNSASLQLFTAPVGNRVPIVELEFSKPVLPAERERWRARIRTELSKSNFPRGVRGFFVGISAVYHAMKMTGLTDRIIDLKTATEGLATTLEKLDLEDQRSIANLTLVHELLQWVFDSSTSLIFKREWEINGEEYVATWTFGLFTHQHTTLMSKQMTTRRNNRWKDHWKLTCSRIAPPLRLTTKIQQSGRSRASSDNLFEVPFVAWPFVDSYMLDFGSGEIGVYVLNADIAVGSVTSAISNKIGEPFYESFVQSSRVGDFAKLLVSEFKLLPAGTRHEVIAGGATGIHREMLVSDQEKRDQIFNFISKVEDEVSKIIGRPVTIRIFVPSGELEAQFELRGVKWLIGRPDVDIIEGGLEAWMIDMAFNFLSAAEGTTTFNATRKVSRVDMESIRAKFDDLGISQDEVYRALHRTANDVNEPLLYHDFVAAVGKEPTLQAMVRRCDFSGTISAGGGSSQVTITGSMKNSMVQLYSMPVGNRLPIIQRFFSTPVTWEQRSDWVERIRKGLHASHFPRGVRGLFVGISAMYHAAKMAQIADRLVPKREAMQALADCLARLDTSDHRSIANVTLAKEIIGWVFDDEKSCLLFKRNWKSGGSTLTAGWTFGWYVAQFEGDAEVRVRAVVHIQRVARGNATRNKMRALTRELTEKARKLNEDPKSG